MDFFAQQDRARASTRRFIVLYVLALLAVVVSLNVVTVVVFGYANSRASRRAANRAPTVEWSAATSSVGLYAATTLSTLTIIALATMFKQLQVGGDGAKVAEMLGGRPLNGVNGGLDGGTPTDLDERKLLNVVEEMALASGVPTPRVYLLEAEGGINAFAAGLRPEAAVIGVTRGAVQTLSRDELQGVIAHEFSHILNGDMRLNIRMITLNFGIMAIGYIGLQIIRFMPSSRSSSSDDKKGGNATAAIFAIGAAMAVIGYIGTLFGKILQSAVSRQREYLADASAVQFTRNPAGIAGALKKIGGYSKGATLVSPNAGEASHMFFGDGTVGFLDSIFATHPPLALRIKAIEPTFDGQMIAPVVGAVVDRSVDESTAMSGFTGTPALPRAGQRMRVDATQIQAARPNVQPRELASAAAMITALPDPLLHAARDPYEARALAIALMLDLNDADVRRSQLESIRAADRSLVDMMSWMWPQIAAAGPAARLPLLDLVLPALHGLSPTQLRQFRAIVQSCAEADRQLSPFELAVYKILDGQLPIGAPAIPQVRFTSVSSVARPVATILSVLANAGGAEQADAAFAAGAARLRLNAPLPRGDAYDAATLGAALDVVRDASPAVQRRVVDAAAYCVAYDGSVRVEEMELMRALCAAVSVPIPPMLVG